MNPNEKKMNRLIQLIEDKTININYTNRNSPCTPLVLLCQFNRSSKLYSALKAFVKRKDLFINSTSVEGFTPLMFLCRFYPREDLIDCAQLLINRGIDVEAREKHGKNSLKVLCKKYRGKDLVNIALLLINRKTLWYDIISCIKDLRDENLIFESEALEVIFKHIREGRNPVNIKLTYTKFSSLVMFFSCFVFNTERRSTTETLQSVGIKQLRSQTLPHFGA